MNKQLFHIFLIILSFIIIINNCKIKKAANKNDHKNYPDMIQNNYRHYIYKNKKKHLYASIEHAEFYEKLKTINCKILNAEIYNSDGDITTIIYSDEGKIDKKEKKMLFIGNVVFELLENETKLYGDEIELDYKNNKLISKKDVLFKKEDGSYIKASSMDSDIKLESTKFEDMEIKYFYDDEEK